VAPGKMTRAFAVIILLLGIAQAIVGTVGMRVLVGIDEIAQILEDAQMDIPALKVTVVVMSVVLLIGGSAFLVSALGLFRYQEWARRLWLIVISLSLIFYATWFVFELVLMPTVISVSRIELLVVIAIFAVSWSYFSRRTVRQTFLAKRGS
jgi:hypothetical protein